MIKANTDELLFQNNKAILRASFDLRISEFAGSEQVIQARTGMAR
jgi:hypothetical protein